MHILGLDIGGTGIKGAPVDLETGKLLADVVRKKTPDPATPDSILATADSIVREFSWEGPIGCGFPAVVQRGFVRTASNIDDRWLNLDAAERFSQHFGRPTGVINDADAAGLAEMRFGAGRERDGLVLMLTLGTGIGTALFNDGQLVPNLELGQIEVRGKPGHEWAAASVREERGLSWEAWAHGLEQVLKTFEAMLWPNLIIIGGGISKEADKFLHLLTINAKIVPAQLGNEAGIIGAALIGDR
ncbi:MAG TPA: ROK family protein [Herpetosiphonaceae bacterium]|nr:ROK family protein [Herpetosiphonaceae bacterium]